MKVTQLPTARGPKALALLAALALAACGGGSPTTSTPAAAPPPSSAAVILDASNFDASVASGVSLVDFYHPSCSHCRAMEPVVERLAADFQGQAVVGKVNVTTDGALATAWGVRAYPTFIVIKDGEEHSTFLGETTYDQLAHLIRMALEAP